MSERPKWMPTVSRILELAHAGNSPDAWEWECDRTGLRAQVAVLEELIAHMRSRYTNEANPTGSYCNEESLWIADKIEEIRRKIE